MVIVTNKGPRDSIISCSRVMDMITIGIVTYQSGGTSISLSVEEALTLVDILQDAINSFDEGDEK